jgi:RHS repeat-associated protein
MKATLQARRVGLSLGVTATVWLAGLFGGQATPPAWGMGPVLPINVTVPDEPIVYGSGDVGTMPGSSGVSSTGEFTYAIPLEVPAGRGGMQPQLKLSYGSRAGNGALGMGWSLDGLSSLARCGQTLASDGQVQGVHLTDSSASPADSDRFCLDGKRLIALGATYGQLGTEYRTEEDSYARIQEQAAPSSIAQAANEPMFVVTTKDGRTRTYTALYANAWQTGLNGNVALTGTYATGQGQQAIVSWALTSEVDRAGNGMQYHYCVVNYADTVAVGNAQVPLCPNPAHTPSPPASWQAGYGPLNQWLLQSIVYTTAADGSDSGQRQVAFTYDDRPDKEFGFSAGVGTALLQRLTTITMSAPNPGPATPVWRYALLYATGFSGRSLLTSVQRCALQPNGNQGSCALFKTFVWSQAGTPTFVQEDVTAPIGVSGIGTQVWQAPPQAGYASSGTGSFAVGPYIEVLDANGDGADDVLFQPGALPQVVGYQGPTPAAPMLMLTTRDAAGAIHPLSQSWDLTQYGGAYSPPYVTYVYGGNNSGSGNSNFNLAGNTFAPLERVYPLDLQGSGQPGIFVPTPVFVNGIGNGQCVNKVLQWSEGGAFVDSGITLPAYDCSAPNILTQFHTFLDADGDGLLDHAQAPVQPPGGGPNGQWMGIPADWQISLNQGGGNLGPLSSQPPLAAGLNAGCPTYAVDFSGEGRAQLLGQIATDTDYPANGLGQNPFGTVNCGASATYTFSPRSGQWTLAVDTAHTLPALTTGISTMNAAGTALSTVGNVAFAPIFGDFNGDGLEDVIQIDANGTAWLRWNTGHGFGPPLLVDNTPWAVIDTSPYGLENPPSFQVRVADIDGDGRADLVVFHSLPQPGITLMLSNGDGFFASFDLPAEQNDPGIQTALGWTTSTLGDFNGDGVVDIVRLKEVAGSASNFNDTAMATLQVLQQVPQFEDKLQGVCEELKPWCDVRVAYEQQWSDKLDLVVPCTYPLRCVKRGMTVVREVDYRDALANPTQAQIDTPRRVYYSYEDPVSDLRGRGFLGFRKVREFDPQQPRQTITEYDNRTCAPVPTDCTQLGTYYPGANRAQRITTVVPLPSPSAPQTLPTVGPGFGVKSAYARVTQTVNSYSPSSVTYSSGGSTYIVPQTEATTTEWEQTVQMDASPTDPANPSTDYMWNTSTSVPIVAPSTPLRVHTQTIPAGCPGTPAAPCIDGYGNVLMWADSTQNGVTTTVSTTYNNTVSPTTWQIGLVNTVTATAQEADGTSTIREVGYDYDPLGLLKDTFTYAVNAGSASPSLIRTTTLTRDTVGNITSIATTGSVLGSNGQLQPQTRQVNIEYDPWWASQPNERIFPSQYWMPAALPGPYGTTWQPSVWTLVYPANGVPVASVDANGVETQAIYDDQGRDLEHIPAAGDPTLFTYAVRSDTYGGINGMVVTAQIGGQTSTVSTDAAGRTLQSTHLGFDGTLTTMQSVYDLYGRLVQVSRPYQGNTPEYWTSVLYDGLSRTLSTTFPDQTQATHVPTFFTDTYTDANANVSVRSLDLDGRLITSMNELVSATGAIDWAQTQYHYVPFNQVDRVIDPTGAAEFTNYDPLGRIIGHYSADGNAIGCLFNNTTSCMQYDGFDELVNSVHSNAQGLFDATTSHTYDLLGRTTGWSTVDTSSGSPITTAASYTYDTQIFGLGKLVATQSTATMGTSTNTVTTAHYYDNAGRPRGMDETIDGQIYSVRESYDNEGRLSEADYPAIGSSALPGVSVQYAYTPSEYVQGLQYQIPLACVPPATTCYQPLWTPQVLNADDAVVAAEVGNTAGSPLRILNTYDAAMGRLQETQAAVLTLQQGHTTVMDLSYGYDPNGLVNTRTDAVNNRAEHYVYDGAHRLVAWGLINCPGVCATLPTGTGTLQQYGYEDNGNLTQVTTTPIVALNATPVFSPSPLQANTYGENGAGPHALTTQTVSTGAVAYGYDALGRQVTGNGRTVTYNAYDLPVQLTTPTGSWSFQYNAFGERVKKAGTDGTTYYVGDAYEKRLSANGTEANDIYKLSGEQVEISETNGSVGRITTDFVVTDPLGSVGTVIDATTLATQNTFFYDPFGARISAAGAAYTPARLPLVREGFTGQEQEDDLGGAPGAALINFKGRMYDPGLKRFLSMDPMVGAPSFGQSWNPYSYVYNSPLNNIDPSGLDTLDGTTDAPAQCLGGCSGTTSSSLTIIGPASGGASSLVTLDPLHPFHGASPLPGGTLGGAPSGAERDSDQLNAGGQANQSTLLRNTSAGFGASGQPDNRIAAIATGNTPEECKAAWDRGSVCIVRGSINDTDPTLSFGPAILAAPIEIAEVAATRAGLFARALRGLRVLVRGRAAIEAAEAAEAATAAAVRAAALLAEQQAQREVARVALEAATHNVEAAEAAESLARKVAEDALRAAEEFYAKNIQPSTLGKPMGRQIFTGPIGSMKEIIRLLQVSAGADLELTTAVARAASARGEEVAARAAYEAADAAVRGSQAAGTPYRIR